MYSEFLLDYFIELSIVVLYGNNIVLEKNLQFFQKLTCEG